MKTAFGILVLIVSLMWLGWISFSVGDGQQSVTFDTEEVSDDAAAAVKAGKDILEDGQDFLESVRDDDPTAEEMTKVAQPPEGIKDAPNPQTQPHTQPNSP